MNRMRGTVSRGTKKDLWMSFDTQFDRCHFCLGFSLVHVTLPR
jgi:hypothetical protein